MARRINLTKLEITQTAIQMFLEKGYSATSPKMICQKARISPGSLTYYYPTKEHLLAVLIQMLADFQWKFVQDSVNNGETPITALCFELTAMAAVCEENERARDLYISAYTSQKAMAIIRSSENERAKTVFAEYCRDWTEEMFAEAEILVSGIEYATLLLTPDAPELKVRIAGAMQMILGIYNVPEEQIKEKIEKALSMDYRRFGQEVLDSFKTYVSEVTENIFSDVENIKKSNFV